MRLTLSSISLCLLGIVTPRNRPSWARKVLIGHHIRVPRWFLGSFLLGGLGSRVFSAEGYSLSDSSSLEYSV